MDEQKKSSEFNFSVFWHNFVRTLPRMLWIPIIFCLLAAGYRYYRVRRAYSPVYQTFAVYRVSADRQGSIDLNTHGYYLDANAATKLAATYPYVMSSDQCKALLQEKYGTRYLPSTVTCKSEATMLILTSRGSTPQRAYDGLQMAAEVFPEAGAVIGGKPNTQVPFPANTCFSSALFAAPFTRYPLALSSFSELNLSNKFCLKTHSTLSPSLVTDKIWFLTSVLKSGNSFPQVPSPRR